MTEEPPVRRRGPYKRGIAQRQRILAEATREFARNGYTASSLRTIAASVGISHPAVVQFFGSKEGLLLAVLEAWDEDLSTLFADRSGLGFLRAMDELMQHHENERGIVQLFIMMSAEATDAAHPAHEFMVRRSTRVRELCEANLLLAGERGEIRALTAEEARDGARELTAMMNGIELQWLIHAKLPPARVFHRFLDRFLADLGAREDSMP